MAPSICVLCDGHSASAVDLCPACQSNMPFNLHCCAVCALPLPRSVDQQTAALLCGKCLQSPSPFGEAVIPYLYRPPVDFMIRRLKFSQDTKYSKLIGELISQEVRERDANLPDCLIPVPMHGSRYQQRGFNQASLIAGQVSQCLSIPVDATAVTRTATNDQQAALGARAREKNMRRAFSVTSDVTDRSFAIVDDVFTTGATCNALARSLLSAGARQVDVWAFARTP